MAAVVAEPLASGAYRVAIVGTGGVGAYFAARLAQAGCAVFCVARGAHLEAISLWGVRVTSFAPDGDAVVRGFPAFVALHPAPAETRSSQVRVAGAFSDPASIGPVDLVVVALKTWQLHALDLSPLARVLLERQLFAANCSLRSPSRLQLGPTTLLMPTQNGVDAPGVLGASYGPERVLGGYTRITSLLTGPGCVAHTALHPAVQGTGLLPGAAPWAAAALGRAATAWAKSPFLKLVIEPDVRLSMWRKLTVMAAYSAVCAASRCPIGPLLAEPSTRALLRSAMAETVATAVACGVAMSESDVESGIAVLESLHPGCTPSMQRDVLAGKPSELEDQAGAVLRIAKERGVPTPVLGVLYAVLGPQERVARGELVLPAHTESSDHTPMDSLMECARTKVLRLLFFYPAVC